ncbi:MAG: histidine kinase N-terminal 7TM domain-containing protein, partial [Dehalococcoidia bacterium]|nr:histidine kinase N-terminal 7TM domain-containing protein [Dehalococcoidia bacterium]
MHLYLIIPPIISFVLSFSLAVLVLLRDPQKTTYRLFAIFLVTSGLWGLIILAFRISPDVEHAKFWIRGIAPLSVLSSAAFMHFSFLYTRVKVKGWIPVVIYTLFLLTLGLALAGMTVKDVTRDIYGFLPVYTVLQPASSVVCYILIVIGLVNFIRAYKKSDSFNERNSYLYIVIGILSSMVGGLWDYLSTTELKIPPVGLIGSILFGALATVAIMRYHLLDIRIMVRKSVAYLLTSTVVAIPYVGVIILFNIYFQ